MLHHVSTCLLQLNFVHSSVDSLRLCLCSDLWRALVSQFCGWLVPQFFLVSPETLVRLVALLLDDSFLLLNRPFLGLLVLVRMH